MGVKFEAGGGNRRVAVDGWDEMMSYVNMIMIII